MEDEPVDYGIDLHQDEYVEADPSITIDGFEIVDDQDEFDAIELFRYAVTQHCSDIHLKVGSPPKLRVDGELFPITSIRNLTSEDTDWIRQQTMSDSDQGEFVNRKYDHSYAYELPGVGRFRMIVVRSLGTLALVARKLVDTPPTFDDLDTKEAIRDLANFPSGLILVSGITGSGKSTLMAAMIQKINATQGRSIVSIEDPVEIIHSDIKSSIIQRNIGTDVPTFSSGVRDAMRQDPDVILIGEIRDTETAQAALKAAETGHLVISTIHAKTSITSIGRMLDLFAGDELKSVRNRFADVLRGIVSQKLVKSTQLSGRRVSVNEILLNTHELKLALEQDASPSELRSILENGTQYGMLTFEQHFLQLVELGLITEKVALAQATEPTEMQEMLNAWKTEQEKKVLPPAPHSMFPTKIRVAEVNKPVIPFSKMIQEEDEENGVVVHRSGAALEIPKAPVRPTIYLPPFSR